MKVKKILKCEHRTIFTAFTELNICNILKSTTAVVVGLWFFFFEILLGKKVTIFWKTLNLLFLILSQHFSFFKFRVLFFCPISRGGFYLVGFYATNDFFFLNSKFAAPQMSRTLPISARFNTSVPTISEYSIGAWTRKISIQMLPWLEKYFCHSYSTYQV